MVEFEPKRKNKIVDKQFIAKYSYVLVLALLLIGGISYGYTFFKENRKISSGSITTANLTIDFSNRELNATNLSVPLNDEEGLNEFSKSLTITNQTSIDGRVKLKLTRTSGLSLSDMRYAIMVNGAIQEIDDVPDSGEILSSAIMGNDTMNVELRLWPKSTYSGLETTFIGEITPEIKYLGDTASNISNPTGKYVNFNCSNNSCEVWQIVKIEDDRLVLTRQADYTDASSRVNSNRYNSSLTFNDNSLITSVSTDDKNVYLAKTVKINGGVGTQENPYTLINTDFREEDKKVVAVITYKNNTTTVGTQNIYYNENNYISRVIDDPDFEGWTDGTNNYVLGSTISINTDTNLSAVLVKKLTNKIMKLCNDSTITYVEKYNTSNGTPIDTPDGSGNKDVCYYTSVDSNNEAGQYGNVIFGDFCWQIVRTTANGGVKLIYNGPKTNDNKCPSDNSLRPTTLGASGVSTTEYYQLTNVSGNKTYGSSFEIFNDNGTNKFRLKNTFMANWNGDYDNDGNLDYSKIIGNFVCGSSSSPTGSSDTCTTLYYVGHYENSTLASVVKYSIATNPHYSIIGKTPYNDYNDSLSQVGYMYNDTYLFKSKNLIKTNDIISYISHDASSYYGDKAVWNPSTNMYDLMVDDGEGNYVAPSSTIGWSSIRSNVKGKYSCNNIANKSCATVHYFLDNSSNAYAYSVVLSDGEDIDTKSITLNYSSSYSKNGSDYILDNPTSQTFLVKDWYTVYATYKNFYVCDDFTSTTCSKLYYVNNTSQYQMKYNELYIFGNSVSYQNGNYSIDTSNDISKYKIIAGWNTDYNQLSSSHYTCLKSDTNDCGSSVYYVFYTTNSELYYVELKNDERVNNALEKMLNINNSNSILNNKYSSSIKGIIDSWYEENLLPLASYLDNDAVYCNDRIVTDYAGWSPTGSITGIFNFKYKTVPSKSNASLSCSNITDRLSKNNLKATLKYPIALISSPEAVLMSNNYVKTSQQYFLLTPTYQYGKNISVASIVATTGAVSDISLNRTSGIRPAITIKPDVTITGGNGTYDTPYIIDTNN